MKPEVSAVQPGFEHGPIEQRPSIERVPQIPSPEQGVETGADRREQVAEATAAIADAGLPLVLPSPVAIDDNVVDDTAIVSDAPITAGDDDLIEKEWVDKAKKIIAETKDNPYAREEAVSKLQSDYLKKRYGRELGAAQ